MLATVPGMVTMLVSGEGAKRGAGGVAALSAAKSGLIEVVSGGESLDARSFDSWSNPWAGDHAEGLCGIGI